MSSASGKMEDCRVVGIGSHHGDDSVGWRVLDQLASFGLPVPMVRARSPIELLDQVHSMHTLHVVDACWGEHPGRMHRWVWPCDIADSVRWPSTHSLDVIGVLHLGQKLGLLPAHTILWGIETQSFEIGTPVSQEANRAILQLAHNLRDEILGAMASSIDPEPETS